MFGQTRSAAVQAAIVGASAPTCEDKVPSHRVTFSFLQSSSALTWPLYSAALH